MFGSTPAVRSGQVMTHDAKARRHDSTIDIVRRTRSGRSVLPLQRALKQDEVEPAVGAESCPMQRQTACAIGSDVRFPGLPTIAVACGTPRKRS